MSEQKVWVEKMPESCSDCPCCNYGNDDEKDYSCNLMKWDEDSLTDDNLINKRPENCPLHTTSELVKEVCEKIREHLSEQKKSLKDTFSPYSNGKAFIISAVEENLNKIEKEYEK